MARTWVDEDPFVPELRDQSQSRLDVAGLAHQRLRHDDLQQHFQGIADQLMVLDPERTQEVLLFNDKSRPRPRDCGLDTPRGNGRPRNSTRSILALPPNDGAGDATSRSS
jgi:hypothetical protein